MDADDDGTSIFVNGDEFSLVILATGTSLDIAGSPLHTKIANRFPTQFEGNMPVLTQSLRWSPSENIFVMGALAALELGPGALNLMGAKVGAQLVANELMTLLWRVPEAPTKAAAGKLRGNWFAMLDNSSDYIDGVGFAEGSSDDEGTDGGEDD